MGNSHFAVSAFLSVLAVSGFGQENYSQWPHSRAFVINTSPTGYNITGNLSNFPYVVRLTAPDFNFSQVKTGGADIRFANATGSHLSYQIEQWDTVAKQAAVWVLVDNILGNNATQAITMYWGKSDAADSSKGSAVFTAANGFVGVYHLDQASGEADGTTIPYNNAAGTGNNGKDFVASNDKFGVIGKGQGFDGENDHISIDRPVQDDFTISFWMKANGDSKTGDKWYQGNGLVDAECPMVVNDFGVAYLNNKAAFGTGGTSDNTIQSTSDVSMGWHHIATTRNKTTGAKLLYVDGIEEASGTGSTLTLSTPAKLFFGGLQTEINCFAGRLDEVEISIVIRSADWIKLSCLNQKPLPPASVPSISYPKSEYVLEPNVFIDAITPSISGEEVDSVTIDPALPDYLTFDRTSGAITGWAADQHPKTPFYIKAYNPKGFSADTIWITIGDMVGVKGHTQSTITCPLSIARVVSTSNAIAITLVGDHAKRASRLTILNARGQKVFAMTVSDAATIRVRTGPLAKGVYFVELNSGAETQTMRCVVR